MVFWDMVHFYLSSNGTKFIDWRINLRYYWSHLLHNMMYASSIATKIKLNILHNLCANSNLGKSLAIWSHFLNLPILSEKVRS